MKPYLLLLLVVSTLAHAHDDRARYESARALKDRFENRVFQDRVRPHWFDGDRRFWYRNDLQAGTSEFILVETEPPNRRRAFDHERLAGLLTQATGQLVNPHRLRVENLRFENQATLLRFHTAHQAWRLDLQTYELQRDDPTTMDSPSLPIQLELQSTRRTGEETSVIFVNRTGEAVRLFWLDSQGQRRAYGTIDPGAEHQQHTFGGHVWLATDARGGTLGVYEATDEPSVALLDSASPAPHAPPPPRPRGDGQLSPDGRWQAFFSDHNLQLRDVSSEETFSLSTEGTAEDAYSGRVHWSPDSRRLVVFRTRQGSARRVYYVESTPRDQLQPKLHSYPYRKPGDEIPRPHPVLFEVDPHRAIPIENGLFDNPWSLTDLRWAADSRAFTFLYNQRGHQVLRVVAVDAGTGRARVVVDEQSPTFIDYAGKLFLHPLDASDELIWMSERDGWNHLYLYDTASGTVKNPITRGPWVVRSVDHVDEEQRQVWFRAGGIFPGQDPYFLHHARVQFDGSGLTLLTQANGTHRIEYSPTRRFVLDTWSRVDHPPVIELRSAIDGARLLELERADWGPLLESGWRAPEPFVAKGRDGQTDIHGMIVRPTHFQPGQKYPVIENIYAGPQSAYVPKAFRAFSEMQVLAELGFVVVQIDGMGTSHRSKTFHDVCWQNLGDAGLPDRIAWLQAAALHEPTMDLDRVGIYGGSAGGQNALRALLAHGDFYKVGVADCGCHDNRMDKIWWNELWMGWPIGPHYEEQSNVTQAHRLQGKLLLIVGEMDENVDPASTLQVVHALIQADKDFDLLLIPGQGHGAAETDYGKRRRAQFFMQHLQPPEAKGATAAPH
jgi:dipeptidyl-peptidase 4